ncbi:MAG: SAM-dependent methyltransferase [Thermodesulfobacteriota bacterium]
MKNKLINARFSIWLTPMLILLATAVWLFPCPAHAWGGRGHLYVIGTGPAGPQTATLQALDTLKRMDAILAPQKHVDLFADYVEDKPVLFDPWTDVWDYKGKRMWALDPEEAAQFKKARFRIRDERVAIIKKLLSEGKDVGLMDHGNPCLYGPSHWYAEQFDDRDVVIIPGMGCDAAAMAALKKSTIPAHDARFVIQTSPFSLMRWGGKESQILKDLSRHPSTLIFYMALWKPAELFDALQAHFSPDMPCAVVFWAGYPEKERVLRGTVADMQEKLNEDSEKFMGLLVVGRFLEGKPYEAAMRRAQKELGKGDER